MDKQNELRKYLTSVDWNDTVKVILKDSDFVDSFSRCNYRLALWAKQFEIADIGNPALPFIRAMQASGHNVAVLTSLALYQPAASSMRTVLESALYYTYFRTHPSELNTLVRDNDYFVMKKELLDYHKQHTPGFKDFNKKFSFISKMDQWYGKASGIIHGQIPGVWINPGFAKTLKHNTKILKEAVQFFKEGEDIVHLLFLATIEKELWNNFSKEAKNELIRNVSSEIIEFLQITVV